MGNIYGIDVSEHNGVLDWAKIKASGVKFAIIRTGYGVSHQDTCFKTNMAGAIGRGIPVGVYHFSYALDVAGAKKEAAYVLSLLESYKDKITLPVFFDFEYDTVSYASKQGVTLGKQAFNDHAVAFLETVRAAGYVPGIYYNLDYKNRFVDDSRLGSYVQWYAQYASKASWNGYDLWQYSSSHTINGHSCRFDINVADETFLGAAAPEGWVQADGKWYYYLHGALVENQLVAGEGSYTGQLFWCGEDGAVVVSSTITVNEITYTADESGRLTEIVNNSGKREEDNMSTEKRYEKLGDVTSKTYRATLDKLIDRGVIKGREGDGEDLVIDLGEDAIRLLVYLDRAGVFGE